MSANNTLEVDDDSSNVNDKSLPTTTSVLDKSRSLFGNSSTVLSKPAKETTPDRNEGEPSVGTEPSVTMEKQEHAGDTTSIEGTERVSAGAASIADDESMDTTEPQEPPKPDSVDEVEESFEKKTISMDTSDAAENNKEDEVEEKEQNKDEEEGNVDADTEVEKMEVEVEGEEEEDDEEEEVPKKKAKRTAVSDEDEEDRTDEQSGEASSGDQVLSSESNSQASPVKASGASSPAPLQERSPASSQKVLAEQSNGASTEQAEESDEAPEDAPVEEEEEEEVEAASETMPTEDQEDVDTAETVPAEDEVADEPEATAPAEVEEGDETAEGQETADEDNEVAETDGEMTIAEEEPTSSTRSGRSKRTSTAAPTPTSTATPRRGRGRQSTVKTPAEDTKKDATPARRGRSSRGAEKKEEQVAQEEPEEQEEEVQEEVPEETPKRGRGRRSVAAKPQEVVEVAEEEEEQVEEETPKRKGRGRRSAPTKEEVEEVAEEAPEVEDAEKETPKRGRGRRSVQTPSSSASSAPRSARGRGRKTKVEEQVDEEPVVEEEEQEVEEEEANDTTEKPKTPRGRKSAAKPEVEEEEAPETPDDKDVPTSSRRSARSTRGIAKPHPTTPAVTNKRTPARGRKKEESVTEETIEEVDEPVETPPAKRGRGGASKSGPSPSKKAGGHDPYDMDTEMEHHPEPLKRIHMEVQNFGTVKYASSGAESKYAKFESIAESRIGDLQSSSSSSSSNNRRSLADMTPGKDKPKSRGTPGTGRKPRAKKEEAHQNDVEMEEATPAEPSAAPTPSGRGRKRKSEASEQTSPPAKREQHVELKELDCEEQLRVDHPQDDNEPHAPGARVYAIYQKAFYPAVILSERDGLGRYKIQFISDKLVKDVPNSGIIPLRVLTIGKIAIYNEEDVRLEATPNDISAAEWAKGKVTISMLDDEGDPTDDVKTVEWKDISFDQSEWRDYIKNLDQNATAIVTSNITTIAEASRARKPVPAPQKPKPKPPARKKKEEEVVESRGASMTPADEDEDRVLPMKEEAIGKNIFAGKVFMLTSANRSGLQNVSSMFKKKNLMTFISENGGVVTEQLSDRHADLEPLLISDTYYRTHKYLAALARGIPCVSNQWLQACGEEGECLDYENYILPAGASIFENDTDMPAPKNPSELLKGKAIYVHSTHTARENTQVGPGGTFIEIWKPILEMLGATVIECDWATLDEIELKFDVALVDGTFREEVMSYADKIGAGKVTSEWVIQTIILGKAPDPTAHSKFDPYRLHHRAHH
ncbi:hypothetical protein GCK72_000556 [Caenorhabditis remanei]|uniref:BRCT domain-containing protein n=1 Tax=Caenorhabditis remanei TaxID=31234 RepID=A0A6A5HR64_CAERE|nr:hypothetical protein GCK72_000556 [Caenorhabditis remanei]KAF1768743.1 hypothetical protein GCK72_000556 [Caenorhabditis remanei]